MHSFSITAKRMGLGLLCLTAACACSSKAVQQVNTAPTMHICDGNGCNDRPANYSSLPPSAPSFEDPQISALKDLAANDSRAAYDLALRYYRGDGVRPDHYQSIQWMRKAGEMGNFEAQKALGRLYLTGLGETGADYGEAQRWLSISVSRGDKEGAQLLKDATMARRAEQDDYQWRRKWELTFTHGWQSGYRYNWNWRPTSGWYLY